MIWLLVPLAFAAMFAQDVLGVWLVQAEAAREADRAARWDMLQDACRIAGLYAGMDALLLSHDLPLKAAVIAATLTADYLGTRAGVKLGDRLDRRKPQPSATVEMSWNCAPGADDALYAAIKKTIRRRGGGDAGVLR